MKTFSIKQAVFSGIHTFVVHLPFLVMAGLVVSIGTMGFPIVYSLLLKQLFKLPGNGVVLLYDLKKSFAMFLQGAQPTIALVLAVLAGAIVSAIISMWSMVAWVNVALKLHDTKSASIHDLFSFMPELPHLISITIVVALGAIFGVIAFIIPGLYWLVRSYFSIESALDKPQEGLEPIRTSFALTKGIFWRLILLFIVILLLNLVIVISASGFTNFCSTFPTEQAKSNCMMVSGLMTVIIVWACTTITTFIKVHVYRQLAPQS